jgi:catechol 2,3-dioxygenase-like lactoylglutathione lyase family enzyme
MPRVTRVGRVVVPVTDQDEAIAFYTSKLGFTLIADMPFGDGDRWIELAPPGGGANVAFGPVRNDFQPGRPTGILLSSPDPAADRAELAGLGVDVDPDVMGGGGGVPVMFSFRDQDKNQIMIVQEA